MRARTLRYDSRISGRRGPGRLPHFSPTVRLEPNDPRQHGGPLIEKHCVIDHISLGVSDLVRSIALYDAILAPLGLVRVWTTTDAAGYGYPEHDDGFAIKQDSAVRVSPSPLGHVAFAAKTRESVTAFHAAGIALGATDEGLPGLCPEDGYRIEAVLHE
jgi:catechol 2,3-dioxygenase-like lactoylglutathione lyase family enzyme